jgi:hypothetical protein
MFGRNETIRNKYKIFFEPVPVEPLNGVALPDYVDCNSGNRKGFRFAILLLFNIFLWILGNSISRNRS